jgi:DegV family protein with EDD domain
VIDSKNLSGALGLIVLRTARAIEEGVDHSALVEMIENWIADSRIFVSVKTLDYMVRGGRVSHLKGFVAKLLNVNPIVSMDSNGKSLLFGKTFSQKTNVEKVLSHIKQISEGKRIWNYIVLHANNSEGAKMYSNGMRLITGREPISTINISPVIGSNAGVGALSVALMFE